ncbi:type II toxin-antitoxin system RelE family toxin [Streptomyces mayteni]
MTYRLSYAPPADDSYKKLGGLKARFDAGMARLLEDPYGSGSTQAGPGDRRRAAVGGVAIVEYYVSGSILTVTVVRLVARP